MSDFIASSSTDASAYDNKIDNMAAQLNSVLAQVSKPSDPKLAATIDKMENEMKIAMPKIEEAAANHKKMTCLPGTDCYDKMNSQDLQKIYNNAKEVAKTAPQDVVTAHKNLITFKYSNHYWNQMERDKYTKLAEEKYNEIVNEHATKTKELDVLIDSYSNYLTNKKNMADYIAKLKIENKHLDLKIRKKLSTLNTNERKVWYETHELGYMSKWTTLMFWIYYIFVFVFIYYFIQQKLWKAGGYRNNKVDIALLVLFVSWGFINMLLSGYLFKLIQFFIGLIPIDAYSKL
jgi:hypothetical protein